MDRQEFIAYIFLNDVQFFYKGISYNIFHYGEDKPYLAGPSELDLLEYENVEKLLNNFLIDGIPLEKLLKDIDVI